MLERLLYPMCEIELIYANENILLLLQAKRLSACNLLTVVHQSLTLELMVIFCCLNDCSMTWMRES